MMRPVRSRARTTTRRTTTRRRTTRRRTTTMMVAPLTNRLTTAKVLLRQNHTGALHPLSSALQLPRFRMHPLESRCSHSARTDPSCPHRCPREQKTCQESESCHRVSDLRYWTVVSLLLLLTSCSSASTGPGVRPRGGSPGRRSARRSTCSGTLPGRARSYQCRMT